MLAADNILHISALTHTVQNHYAEGEKTIREDFAKLQDDLQEAFRKLEEW